MWNKVKSKLEGIFKKAVNIDSITEMRHLEQNHVSTPNVQFTDWTQYL